MVKHAVNTDVLRASNIAQITTRETVRFTVDARGVYCRKEQRVDHAAPSDVLKASATRIPQPAPHIRGDRAVRWERVAAAQEAGLKNIGSITEPKR